MPVHTRSAARKLCRSRQQPLLLDFLPRPAALLLVRCCPLRRCRGCSHDFLCLVTQPALPSVSFRSRSLSAFAAHVRAASAPAAPCPTLTRPQHVASKPRFTVRFLSVALALCLCCPCESCVRPHGLGFVCRSTRPCDNFVDTLSCSLRDHVSQMMVFLCIIYFRKLVDQSPGRVAFRMMIFLMRSFSTSLRDRPPAPQPPLPPIAPSLLPPPPRSWLCLAQHPAL